MESLDNLEATLAQHVEIHRQLPACWNAFFARFGVLRPIQIASIPLIIAGNDVLVTAPTAGGKTEAVVAPICERLLTGRWEKLSTLLITPTRALVNDLFERLIRPLSELGIVLGRKTADHTLAFEIGPEQFIVTTPESLESLLTFRRHVLAHVRAIIIDEIHLLDGGPRGDQLRLLLQRLRLLISHLSKGTCTLQVVALSATLPDARRTADAYLGQSAQIVTVSGQREIDASVITVIGDERDRAEAAVVGSEVFPDVRKALVFVNSRKQVDSSAHYFNYGRFASAAVLGHHGSLSKAERENAEARFKSEQCAICVATMTLEIGIDIGDVDLVICMDPPFSLASFLQRIGRGCRRLQGRTRVLCVASSQARRLIFEGMIEQAAIGLPNGPRTPFRRSVIVQQALAYLKQVDGNRRTIRQLKRALTTTALPSNSESVVESVLSDMVTRGLIDRQGEVYQPASEGWSFIQSSRIFANIESTPLEIELHDVETGNLISTARSIPVGGDNTIRLAGRSFKVVGSDGRRVKVQGAENATGVPVYQPRSLPYAYDVGVMVARRLGVPMHRIVAIVGDSKLFVMTWLGMLNNAFLAEAVRADGVDCRPFPFGLSFHSDFSNAIQALLEKCASRVVDGNLASQVVVERFADLGPHFRLLSEPLQRLARQDWCDQDFLRRWFAHITEIEIVPLDSELGQNLRTVIKP